MPDDPDQLDSDTLQRWPVIRWLHRNSGWLGAVGAIFTVAVAIPTFMGSSSENNGDTVHVDGDVRGGQIAGRDINNTVGDPQDAETITSLIQLNERQQKTIDTLLSQFSAKEQQSNEQIRTEITDAVIAVQDIDADTSQIEQAEAALAQGDTALAQALYREDAENKTAAGEARLREVAESYRRLGALAFLGDIAAALAAYENAVKLWPGDIRAWNQLGHLYQRTGQLDQAIEAYGKVAALADSTDDPQVWTAVSLGNLGIVHHTRGELDQAVAMHEKSLSLGTELGHKEGMAASYGNLGEVHRIRGELEQAVKLYEQALVLNTELGSKEGMANMYSNLGIVHYTRGKLDHAVKMYEKSLSLNTELGSKEGMASVYSNLGGVHHARGELDQARDVWQRSLALFQEIDSPNAKTVQAWLNDLDSD